jgi:hypothetical protein
MNGDIDARQRNRSETAFEADTPVALCSSFARSKRLHFSQHFLDFLDGKGLRSKLGKKLVVGTSDSTMNYLGYVDLLKFDLELVEDIRHSLHRDKLSCTDILLALQSPSDRRTTMIEKKKSPPRCS